MSRQPEQLAAVQKRYEAALDTLIARVRQDPYILAAMLFGSVARGEAWERSDIDLLLIQRDGLKPEARGLWLTEDDLNIWVEIISRSRCRRMIDEALQGSLIDSLYTHGRLLFSKDDSITTWLERAGQVGARDRELQLLRVVAIVPPLLDKAEKWFYLQEDCHYCFLWLLRVVNELARIEVLLNDAVPSREVIYQALRCNPPFFRAVYTDLIDGPKDPQSIQQALDRVNDYLKERAAILFKPVVDYLSEAGGMRTAAEIQAHLQRRAPMDDLLLACEWLARQGLIARAAAPTRLTQKSQVIVEEPAYYLDAAPLASTGLACADAAPGDRFVRDGRDSTGGPEEWH